MQRPGIVPLAVLALLTAGCGGTTEGPAASSADGPAATPLVSPLAPQAVAAVPLREWLGRLAARDGLQATVAPGIEHQPVAGELPAPADAQTLLASLAAYDVTLVYTRRVGAPPELAALAVHAPGGLSAAAAMAAAAHPVPAAAPIETDPARALQVIQHELAHGDAAVRRAALARSFEFHAPLPVPVLAGALQADASAEVRLYALMALARHPQVDRVQLRAWLQAARHDPDAGVRAQVLEVDEQLDAAEQPE